jgi:hypothetical protein
VALVGTGCGTIRDFFDQPEVFDTGIEPLPLELEGPAYTAAVPGGLLVRDGDDQVVLPDASSSAWLPDGRVLAIIGRRAQVVDPANGPVGPARRLSAQPERQVSRVSVLRGNDPVRLASYDLDLGRTSVVDLPGTDNPDATSFNELARNYYGSTPTVDGATFVEWHDGSEFYEDGDYGVLRIEGDEQSNVLVNARIVELFATPDGAALLGLRQTSGQPCGGCVVPQDIVEIDPATGEIEGEYGMPEGYDDGWRVQAVDKVGDRVAVRFYETRRDEGFPQEVPTGTWVFDGSWELLEGSDEVTTWWQGEGRIETRPALDEPARRDGLQLVWISGDDEVELPGELIWARGHDTALGSVAGRLLPPP